MLTILNADMNLYFNNKLCSLLSAEKEDYDELMAVVNERWSAPHVPLLILSCTPTNQQQRIPCVNVVEALKLSSLNRPWQVLDEKIIEHQDEALSLWLMTVCTNCVQ